MIFKTRSQLPPREITGTALPRVARCRRPAVLLLRTAMVGAGIATLVQAQCGPTPAGTGDAARSTEPKACVRQRFALAMAEFSPGVVETSPEAAWRTRLWTAPLCGSYI
jgi:hypothetical protein